MDTENHSKLPVVLLVDNAVTSNDEQDGILNNVLNAFKDFIKKDNNLYKKIEICVVTFRNRVVVLNDYSSIDKLDTSSIETKVGPSLMCSGLLKAIALVKSRELYYKNEGIECLKSKVILLTCSNPDDLFSDSVAKEIQDLLKEYEFYPFFIGKCEEQGFLFGFQLKQLYTEENIGEIFCKNIFPIQNREDDDIYTTSSTPLKVKNTPIRNEIYKIIGASAIGPLHIIKGIPCQDAYYIAILLPGYLIVAIADGLGSALMSEIGSRIAVNSAVASICNRELNDLQNTNISSLAKDSFFAARRSLEEYSAKFSCNIRDLACTLISVIVHNDTIVCAHIGDGAVITKKGDELFVLSSPADSEYANVVTPLTSTNWESNLIISQTYSGISGMMAFTDGIQRAALRKENNRLSPYKGFCEPLFSFIEESDDLDIAEKELKDFLMSKKMSEQSEDDKTLVLLSIEMS